MDLHSLAYAAHATTHALAMLQDSSSSSSLSQDQTAKLGAAMAGMMGIFLLIGFGMIAFFIFLFWRILAKAGLPGPLALICLFPGLGSLIVICILAFSEWKVMPIPQQAYYPPPFPPQPPAPPAFPPSAPTPL
jgi:hypothetical protein